ncbi:hypothetical protein FRC04_010826 [Tulasnella sp. 424]|nr:hypothetical protein FRC04_010826 [Tulasnella sp. 424]
MSNTFTRAYTSIVHTYVLGLNNHDWAVWKAAHACLNADPHGALNTDDLEIAIRTAYPNQHFVRNTLQQNISKSPDFEQYVPPGIFVETFALLLPFAMVVFKQQGELDSNDESYYPPGDNGREAAIFLNGLIKRIKKLPLFRRGSSLCQQPSSVYRP